MQELRVPFPLLTFRSFYYLIWLSLVKSLQQSEKPT